MPGKDKHGSKLQALVRTLVTSAIAGNMRAQALLVGALARVAEVDEQGPNLMTPDDHELLDAFVGDELDRRRDDPASIPSVQDQEEK